MRAFVAIPLPEQLREELAGYAAGAVASGVITGAEGDKFTAGDLGEKEVGAKGEILLGPPTVFDKNNIDDFDF